MARQRNTSSVVTFGLSFLDVLCCGLGAAVLLLLILKRGPADDSIPDDGLLQSTIDELAVEVATKVETKTELEVQVGITRDEVTQTITDMTEATNVQSDERERLLSAVQQVNEDRSELDGAQKRYAQAKAELEQKRIDAEAKKSQSGKRQVTGLFIRKDKVVIMLDASASMFSDNLVDIIRYRVSSPSVQMNAPKWVTAREAAKWAYRRIPDGADYAFLSYSEKPKSEDGTLLTTSTKLSWSKKPQNVVPFNQNVDQVSPLGPTDLKSALGAVRRLVPKPNQVIVITDGLPTVPGNTPLLRMGGCPNFPKKGTTVYLSPRCRMSIMNDARRFARATLQGVPIDVILLPLEGDSRAVHGYWLLSAESGGRLLSPASGWPNT